MVTKVKLLDSAVAIPSAATGTTQSASDNSTKLATTAYVTTALANLSDSAPSTLNTLNELAAALGDDANFSTTVTNSIAAKLPLAGGTMTGNLTISSSTGRMFINNGSGSLVMGSWDGANHRIEGASDRKLLITSYHSDGIHLGASGASDVIIKGGNLGIGETSPDKQLHIKDSGNVGIAIESTTNAQNLDIDFYNNSGSAAGRIRYAEGPGAFGFAPNVSGDDALYITYAGNVGIGTASPSDRLVVQKDTANIEPILVLKNDNTSDDNGISIDFSGKDTGGNNIIYGRIATKITNHATEKSHLIFSHRNDSGSFAEAFRVDHDAQFKVVGDLLVGGTTNLNVLSGTPKIQVGDGTSHSSIQFLSGTGSVGALYFGDGTSGDARYSGYIEYRHNTNTMAFRVNGTDHVTFLANGQISCKNITATDGAGNVSVGYEALNVVQANSGDSNTAMGYQALEKTTTGNHNVGYGYRAGMNHQTGSYDTLIGRHAGYNMSSGSQNTAVGANSLDACTSGNNNTGIGYEAAGKLTTAYDCTAVGRAAMLDTTTGHSNVAIGVEAMENNQTGVENVCIGKIAGRNLTGSATTVIGFRAANGVTSSNESVYIGSDAAYSAGSGNRNVAVGNNAGYQWTTAYNNTCIGYDARTDEYNSYQAVSLGYQCRGRGSTWFTVGSGTSSWTAVAIGNTNWSSSSDERLKENIQTSTAGLSFINDLRPVTFDWKKKKDVPEDLPGYEKDVETRLHDIENTNKHGFIAQEVKEALDKHSEVLDGSDIWNEGPDNVQGVSMIAMIPMLVKALQEADDKIENLNTRIAKLEG